MDEQTLYTINTNNKTKIWSIKVTGTKTLGKIIINTGLEGGKVTIFETLIDKGKNIGKKNETTPLEQAISEAKSKFNKKLDAGYTKTKGQINKTDIILPMLLQSYQNSGHRIKFPCYTQPKIDGLRGVLQGKGKEFGLYSRLKNKFLHLDHILQELKDCPYILDGEIYSELGKGKDNKREKGQETLLTFQELNGLVKKKTLNEQDEKDIKNIIYIVYDFIPNGKSVTFKERYTILKDYFAKNKFKYIKLLETHTVNDKEQLIKYQKKFIKEGYEGIVIRNSDGLYKQKNRSPDVQKFKNFQDMEFKIVGFTEGENSTEKGCIIWICQTKDGKEFNVRPKGSFEERRKLFKNGKKYIGEMLTVSFFDHTDDGIPFHASTMYGGESDIRSLQI